MAELKVGMMVLSMAVSLDFLLADETAALKVEK